MPRTASLTATDPRLPPTTIMTGLSEVKCRNSRALNLSPDNNSCRIGEPVRTAFPSGRYSSVSGKLQHTFVAADKDNLLASPGVISDS